MEGRSYWIVKTAPVSVESSWWPSFLLAYLPTLLLSWLFLLGVALLQNVPSTSFSMGYLNSLILAGLGGINLAFGVRGANLAWTDPRHMESGVAGLVGMVTSIAYQLVTLLLFFGPPLGFPLLGIAEGVGRLVGLLVGGTVALLCTILPLVWVRQRVYRIGEEQI